MVTIKEKLIVTTRRTTFQGASAPGPSHPAASRTQLSFQPSLVNSFINLLVAPRLEDIGMNQPMEGIMQSTEDKILNQFENLQLGSQRQENATIAGRTTQFNGQNQHYDENTHAFIFMAPFETPSLSRSTSPFPQSTSWLSALSPTTKESPAVIAPYRYAVKHIKTHPDYRTPKRPQPNFTITQWRRVDEQEVSKCEDEVISQKGIFTLEEHERHISAVQQMSSWLRNWRDEEEREAEVKRRANHPLRLVRCLARDDVGPLEKEPVPIVENRENMPVESGNSKELDDRGKKIWPPKITLNPPSPQFHTQISLTNKYAHELMHDHQQMQYYDDDYDVKMMDCPDDYYIDDLDEVWAELMRLPTAKSVDGVVDLEKALYRRYYGFNVPLDSEDDQLNDEGDGAETRATKKEKQDEGDSSGRTREEMIFLWAACCNEADKGKGTVEEWEEKVLEVWERCIDQAVG